MTEKNRKLHKALLDSVVISGLKELTEHVSTRHDLVWISAFADFVLAKIEQLKREWILCIVHDLVKTSGKKQLLKELEQRNGDTVNLLIVLKNCQNTFCKGENLFLCHSSELREETLA